MENFAQVSGVPEVATIVPSKIFREEENVLFLLVDFVVIVVLIVIVGTPKVIKVKKDWLLQGNLGSSSNSAPSYVRLYPLALNFQKHGDTLGFFIYCELFFPCVECFAFQFLAAFLWGSLFLIEASSIRIVLLEKILWRHYPVHFSFVQFGL